MSSSATELAIRQLCEEKGVAYDSVIEIIQSALGAAYRKDFGDKYMNLEVTFNPATSETHVFDVKNVVDDITPEELEEVRKREAQDHALREARKITGERPGEHPSEVEDAINVGPKFNPKTDIMISDARILKMSAKVGEVLRRELPIPGEFGRMAAMTAKQVILQKIREAEREIIFGEFKGVEGTVMSGTVQRREGRVVIVDIGKTTGVVKAEDQMSSDRYRSGDRLMFFVREVSLGARGVQILLSRTHEALVKHLFETEIPEIGEGSVEIKGVAREAGSRSKIAVMSHDNRVDPIGACIGQRGTRIQTVISELAGEKIDVIEWDADLETFLRHALAPAKISRMDVNSEERIATVHVTPDQLSLAIGKGGQNVRLAARLTSCKINIFEEGAESPASVDVGSDGDEK